MPVSRKLMKKVFIGIDPGKKGGLVAIQDNKIISCCQMPETKLETWEWFKQFTKYKNKIATLEKVNSFGQGRTSAFTFGGNYHSLESFLIAAEISYTLATPVTWQRQLKIPKKKKGESPTEFKKRLKKSAQGFYPALEIWKQPRSEGKQLAICDALLIATYCKLTMKDF